MAQVSKIDSNVTGLRYSVESALGTAGTVWYPLDPNSYNDFGGNFTKTARTPINNRRSRYKGVLTDLESAGGFNIDMTQTNIQDLFQGFVFDQFVEKGRQEPTAVTATQYTVADSSDFAANDLVFASGFSNSANNGLKVVGSVAAGAVLTSGLVAEGSPPAGAKITRVGHQFGSGDCEIDASGDLPIISTTTKDLTELGLVDGELIYIGGDTAATEFATATDNGWCRVRTTGGANSVTLDKASGQMVTDAGGSKTIQIFFGRTLKNQEGTAITRTSYQLERTLGAPDDASPSDEQAEYIVGAVPNELTMSIDTADKIMVDMGFMGIDYETNDAATGPKAGTRPSLASGSGKAFNTSTHVTRIRMGLTSDVDEYVDALFAYVTEIRLSINNNLTMNKAVGTLGAFEITAGTFEVGGNVTAYFQNTAALEALRANSDITLDVCVVKDNAGFSFDLPLLSLDDGRLNVELNQAVTIPLGLMAADGEDVNANLAHTIVMSFYDYLPDAAEA
ncbi:major structural protein [Roseobacter phage RDJL3]|nr:major structural protein [Roseobacter phage RDJL3]